METQMLMMWNLNSLLINKVSVSYDKQRNKLIFQRSLPVSTQNYAMYLNIINSEDFLGFYKVIETPIYYYHIYKMFLVVILLIF